MLRSTLGTLGSEESGYCDSTASGESGYKCPSPGSLALELQLLLGDGREIESELGTEPGMYVC